MSEKESEVSVTGGDINQKWRTLQTVKFSHPSKIKLLFSVSWHLVQVFRVVQDCHSSMYKMRKCSIIHLLEAWSNVVDDLWFLRPVIEVSTPMQRSDDNDSGLTMTVIDNVSDWQCQWLTMTVIENDSDWQWQWMTMSVIDNDSEFLWEDISAVSWCCDQREKNTKERLWPGEGVRQKKQGKDSENHLGEKRENLGNFQEQWILYQKLERYFRQMEQIRYRYWASNELIQEYVYYYKYFLKFFLKNKI